MGNAIVTAFGTASSSATLPVTINALEEKNKVDSRISRSVMMMTMDDGVGDDDVDDNEDGAVPVVVNTFEENSRISMMTIPTEVFLLLNWQNTPSLETLTTLGLHKVAKCLKDNLSDFLPIRVTISIDYPRSNPRI